MIFSNDITFCTAVPISIRTGERNKWLTENLVKVQLWKWISCSLTFLFVWKHSQINYSLKVKRLGNMFTFTLLLLLCVANFYDWIMISILFHVGHLKSFFTLSSREFLKICKILQVIAFMIVPSIIIHYPKSFLVTHNKIVKLK